MVPLAGAIRAWPTSSPARHPAPGVPPTLCSATEPNGVVANDEELFTDIVDVPTR